MSKEIKNKIEDCYQRLEKLLDPCTFTFHPGADAIWEEVAELQKQCNHHFVDGVCEYCNKEED